MSLPERPSLVQEIKLRHLDIFDAVFTGFVEDYQLFDRVKDQLGITADITLPNFHNWLIALPLNQDEKNRIWERMEVSVQFSEEESIDWSRMIQASFGNEEYEPYTRIVTGLQQAFVRQFIETKKLLPSDQQPN